MVQRGTGPDRKDQRQRARTLAAFFAAGAVVSSLAIVLPGWQEADRVGLAVTVALAAGGALLLVVFAEHVSAGVCHAFTITGTGLIASCQLLAGGGSAGATYAVLYVWVALHCALFFTPGWLVFHLTLTAAAHLGVLVSLGELSSAAPQVVLTVGTQVAAAIVVHDLASRLRRLAETDELTGLGNRRVADRALERALARTGRPPASGRTACLAVLDLDGFKDVNDEHGHATGDRILVEAAATWRHLLRSTDTLTRTGGDEFAVVLPDCDVEAATTIVARLLAHTPGQVHCSAGVALWDGTEEPTELAERADRALYAAKHDGPLVVSTNPAAGVTTGVSTPQ